MSLNISVTIFQMFAAIFMSLSYFRTNTSFLKACDLNFINSFNKTKRNLLKQIILDKKISKEEKTKLSLKIVFSFLFLILIMFFLVSSLFIKLITLFEPNFISILAPILLFVIVFLYLINQSIKKIEPLINILYLKMLLFFYSCIYKLSKQSFIAGLGFIFLFLSFVLDLLNKSILFNDNIFQFIEIFAMFFILLGLTTIAIIFNTYYDYKKNILK